MFKPNLFCATLGGLMLVATGALATPAVPKPATIAASPGAPSIERVYWYNGGYYRYRWHGSYWHHRRWYRNHWQYW